MTQADYDILFAETLDEVQGENENLTIEEATDLTVTIIEATHPTTGDTP